MAAGAGVVAGRLLGSTGSNGEQQRRATNKRLQRQTCARLFLAAQKQTHKKHDANKLKANRTANISGRHSRHAAHSLFFRLSSLAGCLSAKKERRRQVSLCRPNFGPPTNVLSHVRHTRGRRRATKHRPPPTRPSRASGRPALCASVRPAGLGGRCRCSRVSLDCSIQLPGVNIFGHYCGICAKGKTFLTHRRKVEMGECRRRRPTDRAKVSFLIF